MTNTEHFRQFCQSVSKGETPLVLQCTAITAKEVLELLDCASKATPWLSGKGIPAKSSGNGSITENGFSFRAGAYSFTVLPPSKAKTTRPQKVTATSREAYAALDLGPKCEAVARVAIRLGVCTDNEVARELGMVPSGVSDRRNDIEKAGGIVVDGKRYALRMEGSKIDGVTGRRANTWALRAEVERGAQTAMF